jgi:diguanylate cyclase (GGDEF)-like protein
MQKLLVLNLVKHDAFIEALAKESLLIKLITVEEYQLLDKVHLVFTDLTNLVHLNRQKSSNIIGVTYKPNDLVSFYDNDIFTTIPHDIETATLHSLLSKYITLHSIEMLKSTFKNYKYYAFDDFIYYADSVFMHSTLGIAFLTSKLTLLLFNPTFAESFHNIYYNRPILGEVITKNFSLKDNSFWEEISQQASSFKGRSLEVAGKWKDASKHYNMRISPIYKQNHMIGYSVIIEDISKFTNANADLKRYYKYLLDQNTRLEKAYKEVELNNEKLKVAYEKVNALSNRDYLTQAPNRKFFLEKIEYEQLRFKRTKNSFILAYGDIDDFKLVNDTYGHETGDYVLISLTNIIKNAIRNIDFFCRWGGEEFLIFLAESNIELGKQIVERILNQIRDFNFNYNGNIIHITMTFGLAVYDKDQHINQIIDQADQKLYWGKNHNKNQIVDYIPAE